MVKQGPCYHCGVTSTPLWRNGPPEKPVLCNACGSRWRTKGTLANYTPLHSRADFENYEDRKVARTKGVSMNIKKEVKVLKRKYDGENMIVGGNSREYSQSFHKFTDDDTGNWSSSGSALSNSESCTQFGSADASDLTGPAQSVVWDSLVPSRKRTCVNRPKPSAVEKLTRDLYAILHEQQSSCLSGSSEEDLLLESETPMVSVEIGHGSVLIRHPSSIAREEESEASSISVDNKHLKINNVHSHPLTVPVHNNKCVNLPSSKAETLEIPFGQGKEQEQLKRAQHEKLRMLGAQSSLPLSVELRDVLNFDQFVKHLTYEDQQQLLKYLPQIDRANFPDSLRSMFDGAAFLENLSSFQYLLAEGFFDNSMSVAKDGDYKTFRRIVPSNSTRCKWVENYHQSKKLKSGSGHLGSQEGHETVSSNLIKGKGLHDIQKQKYTEVNAKMKSPRRLIMGESSKNKEIAESDGSCFSPRSLLAVPPDGCALLPDPFHFAGDDSEQDLLLDVPSNSSFPQAELLRPAISFVSQQAISNSSFPQAELLRPAMSFVSQQASTSSSSLYTQLVYP